MCSNRTCDGHISLIMSISVTIAFSNSEIEYVREPPSQTKLAMTALKEDVQILTEAAINTCSMKRGILPYVKMRRDYFFKK